MGLQSVSELNYFFRIYLTGIRIPKPDPRFESPNESLKITKNVLIDCLSRLVESTNLK